MFDINEALDRIIFKYHLDKYYPKYRKMRNSETVLTDMISQLCRENIKTLCICSDQLEVEIVKHAAQGNANIDCILHRCKEQEKMDDIKLSVYDKVYIVSYGEYESIANFLHCRNISFEWIYDIFKERDICFDDDFYKFNSTDFDDWFNGGFPGKEGWRNNIQLELFFRQKEYEEARDSQERFIALEKCLFLALHMRNFILSNQYIEELSKKENRFNEANNEIVALLEKIKRKVKHSKKQNIIIYWMDAISYKECEDMSYLQQQMGESVMFENAFTCTPNTVPTLKSMFLGKKMVDDRAYQIKTLEDKDGGVLQLLYKNGYDVKIISGYMKCFNYTRRSAKRHELYDASSMIMWDLLQNLINQSQNTFYIVHSLVESHYPFLTSDMSEESMGSDKIRYALGRQEIDEQLKFYDEFLSEESYRIYMSDHGQHDFRTRYQVIFSIYNKNLGIKKIKSLFSLLDFSKVLEQILEKKSIDENLIKREYAEIQDIDWYNPKLIRTLLEDKKMPDMFLIGYKGVVTEDKIYIKFKTGHEWQADRENVIYGPVIWNSINNIQDEASLTELRRIAGEFPADIDADERFKYSKYVYKLFDKYDQYIHRYISIICEELDEYPNGSVAIRMGGDHSAELYTRLPDTYKKKIACFIDVNKNCVCERYGLPVMSLEQINDKHIKAIVLSSYKYIEMLREEAKMYANDIDVIDIYEALESNGIHCDDNFYMDVQMRNEDYDVGFPFDEVN